MKTISLIDLKPRYENEKEELLPIIDNVLSSGNLILSDENTNLENEINEYLGTKFCLTLNSGTDALMIALWALGIKKGDEVITSAVSFIATAAAIAHVGAKPIFVDVKDDLNIDESKIEEKITPNTKAIIPVHWTGRMCDIQKINQIAKKNNIKVIEDAAQAIGSKINNIRPGKFSEVATFSTHPLKILNAVGDGGFLVTNNQELYEKMKKYRNHGMIGRDQYEFFGVNSRMDALNAAVIRYRLKKVDDVILKRQSNINFFRKKITNVDFKIPDCDINQHNSFTKLVCQSARRDDLQKYLVENGIQSLIYYGTPLHLHKASKILNYKVGDFKKAEKLCDKVISIPFHQYLKEDEKEYIVEKINEFYL
jgi:dTDP-4-amino-4,6-dideoxygalactose transaminase